MIPHIDRPLVYLAGPFSSNPMEGTHRCIAMADRLEATGLITPVIPHLNILWDIVYPHPESFWLSTDLSLLNRCDSLYRLTGASAGADAEVQFCEDNSIDVFFEIDELIAWAEAFVTTPQ